MTLLWLLLWLLLRLLVLRVLLRKLLRLLLLLLLLLWLLRLRLTSLLLMSLLQTLAFATLLALALCWVPLEAGCDLAGDFTLNQLSDSACGLILHLNFRLACSSLLLRTGGPEGSLSLECH